MDISTIEREVYVEARPETVFAVVSEPDHVRLWWPDAAEYEPTPGAVGRIGFRKDDDALSWESFTEVESVPPRRFSFRWTHPVDEVAEASRSTRSSSPAPPPSSPRSAPRGTPDCCASSSWPRTCSVRSTVVALSRRRRPPGAGR